MPIRLCPKGQQIQNASSKELTAMQNYVDRHSTDPTRHQQVHYHSEMIQGAKRTAVRKLHRHMASCKMCAT